MSGFGSKVGWPEAPADLRVAGTAASESCSMKSLTMKSLLWVYQDGYPTSFRSTYLELLQSKLRPAYRCPRRLVREYRPAVGAYACLHCWVRGVIRVQWWVSFNYYGHLSLLPSPQNSPELAFEIVVSMKLSGFATGILSEWRMESRLAMSRLSIWWSSRGSRKSRLWLDPTPRLLFALAAAAAERTTGDFIRHDAVRPLR
jgi:hypothetical protein